MIVYYSGTGNSKYAAYMLSYFLGDKTVSANDYIKSHKAFNKADDKRWVFICPIYVFSPAKIFEDFIKNGNFGGSKDVWFIMTGAGTKSVSGEYYKKICREKGFNYMGTAHIAMPQNYICYFTIKSKKENSEIIKNAKKDILLLGEKILNKEKFIEDKTNKAEYISTVLVRNPYYKLFVKAKKFNVNNDCISCGKCVKICPLNNIILSGGNPKWGKNCTHCMGCINICPKNAINYGRKTQNKPRYFCIDFEKE